VENPARRKLIDSLRHIDDLAVVTEKPHALGARLS
jgi:hypothetical protein